MSEPDNPRNGVLPSGSAPASDAAGDESAEEALAKYKELYAYSTDVLLKEHERFNKADEKAAKYSTMFVFLLGIISYFDKLIFDRIKWPDCPIGIPPEWPVMTVGALALILSMVGWFMSNHVIVLRQIASRPLNQEVLAFFDAQRLLNIYDSFARRNIESYGANQLVTDKKHRMLLWAHRLMQLVVLCLVELVFLYCLYSWA
jgi:hypothetical protein